jgi:hypothetical protein
VTARTLEEAKAAARVNAWSALRLPRVGERPKKYFAAKRLL